MNVLADARVAVVVDIADRLGRKFEATDIAALGAAAIELATNYVQTYDGDFEYVVKLKGKVLSGHLMSDQEIKGALNTLVAEYRRATKKSAKANMVQTTIEVSGLPPSMYKVGNSIIRVDAPTKGKWAGWVFVKNEHDQRLGSAKPGEPLTMVDDVTLVNVMREIADDPVQAVANYGRFTGTCGVCGIKLDDPQSVAQGVGPVCIKRFSPDAITKMKDEAKQHVASQVTPALPSQRWARSSWGTKPPPVMPTSGIPQSVPTSADANAIGQARPVSSKGYSAGGAQHTNAWRDEDLDIAADLAELDDLTDDEALAKAKTESANHKGKHIAKVGEATKPKPMGT